MLTCADVHSHTHTHTGVSSPLQHPRPLWWLAKTTEGAPQEEGAPAGALAGPGRPPFPTGRRQPTHFLFLVRGQGSHHVGMSWKADGCLCSCRHLHSFIVRVIEQQVICKRVDSIATLGGRLERRSRRLSGSPPPGFSTFAHQRQTFVNGDRRLGRPTCRSPRIPSQARCGCRGELCDEDLMRSWFMHGCVREVGFHGGKIPRTPSHTYIHTFIHILCTQA